MPYVYIVYTYFMYTCVYIHHPFSFLLRSLGLGNLTQGTVSCSCAPFLVLPSSVTPLCTATRPLGTLRWFYTVWMEASWVRPESLICSVAEPLLSGWHVGQLLVLISGCSQSWGGDSCLPGSGAAQRAAWCPGPGWRWSLGMGLDGDGCKACYLHITPGVRRGKKKNSRYPVFKFIVQKTV